MKNIQVGDRIKFRAVTRWNGRAVWRKVVAVNPLRVRFGGWDEFVVRNGEVEEVREGRHE